MFIHPLFLVMVVPALVLAMWASFRVKSAFKKYSEVPASSGLTGAEAAAQMLANYGLNVVGSEEEAQVGDNAVAITMAGGFLTDHYDPSAKVLRLSPKVFQGCSLASVGVACHEAGHALQHANGYLPLKLRSALVPIASFGSMAAFPIIILGLLLSIFPLAMFGVVIFAIIVLFQVITLPVEYNASNRAKAELLAHGIIRGPVEAQGVASVLDAAALTYVAGVVSSIATLLYYLMLVTGGSRD